MPRANPSGKFDRAYYDRFYRDPRTRVASRRGFLRLGRFVAAYLAHLEIEVDTVLDLGCGVGHWREVAEKVFPRADYTGVEISEYLCAELGWEQGSVVDWDGDGADLVVCHGVLQYLNARDCRRAIANLARLTEGALYLEVLTREDWDQNVDQSVTDGNVFLREAAWYRRELGKRFMACGGGLFLPRDTGAVLFELERA